MNLAHLLERAARDHPHAPALAWGKTVLKDHVDLLKQVSAMAAGMLGLGLQPGDRVDIYWTGATENSTGEITRLIESTMKIIAVDRNGKSQSSDGSIQNRTMTVAASPEQVARLAL